jgi:glycosyltransferase involved in cell wall biosynthesis
MSRDETLVILTPGFPKDEADCTCLPMQQSFARTLKELYPRLNIIILSFQYPYHKEKYKWFGISVIPFNGRNKGGLSKLLLRKKINAELKEITKENKITGILSFWYNECALVGKRFANKNGIKHYCWILGQDARESNKYIKYIRPEAGELIALSDFIQDEFEKNHGIRPQHVIPPGPDSYRDDPKQLSVLTKERDIDVLAAGSLIPLKQYDIFIEIVAEIKKQLPGIKAMLVGDGPEKDKLRNLIAKLELQGNIALTGELSHPEVLQLMQRTKLFLHPSSYEGFGVVCLEALYGGASVISFVKPMQKSIKNWHIVRTKEEMKEKALEILRNSDTGYPSVSPFLMSDCVEAIGGLFNFSQ